MIVSGSTQYTKINILIYVFDDNTSLSTYLTSIIQAFPWKKHRQMDYKQQISLQPERERSRMMTLNFMFLFSEMSKYHEE